MPNPALSSKLAAKSLVGFLGLFILTLILIGMPGPCGFSGSVNSLFTNHRDLETAFAACGIIGGLAGALISAVWCLSAWIVRLINRV